MRKIKVKKRYIVSWFASVFVLVAMITGCGSSGERNAAIYNNNEFVSAENKSENQVTEDDYVKDVGHDYENNNKIDFSLLAINHVVYENGLVYIWLQNGERGNGAHILLDNRGNVLIPSIMSGIQSAEGHANYAAVMESLGRTVIPYGFVVETSVSWYNPNPYGLVILRERSGQSINDVDQGVINRYGDWIFKPQRVSHMRGFDNNEYIAITTGNRFRVNEESRQWEYCDTAHGFLINSTGQKVFPVPHMEIYPYIRQVFALGYGLVAAIVRPNSPEGGVSTRIPQLWGVFDMYGNEIIAPNLLAVQPFNEGRAIIAGRFLDDYTVQYSAIDIYGNKAFPPVRGILRTFYEGLAGIFIGEMDWTNGVIVSNHAIQWGYIDSEGNEVIAPRFKRGTHFNHGVAVVDYRSTCNWACHCSGPEGIALINTLGEYIIKPYTYYHIWVCDQGVVFTVTGTVEQETHEDGFVRQWITDRRIGMSDLEGNVVVPQIYSNIRFYLINNEGQGPTPDRYPYPIQTFREGRAAVQCYYTGLWGYIDITGYEVIPPQFAYAGTFINGVALVNEGGENIKMRGMIGRSDFYTHHFDVMPAIHGTWHIVDLYGNILESFEYIYMTNINGYVFIYSNEIEYVEIGGRRTEMAPQLVNHGIIVLGGHHHAEDYISEIHSRSDDPILTVISSEEVPQLDPFHHLTFSMSDNQNALLWAIWTPKTVYDVQFFRWERQFLPGRHYIYTTSVEHFLGNWYPSQPLILNDYVFSGLYIGSGISFVDETGQRRHFHLGTDLAGITYEGVFFSEFIDRTASQPNRIKNSINPSPSQSDFIRSHLGDFTLGEIGYTEDGDWGRSFEIQFRIIYHKGTPDMDILRELSQLDPNGGASVNLHHFNVPRPASAILLFSPFFNDIWLAVNDGTESFVSVGLSIDGATLGNIASLYIVICDYIIVCEMTQCSEDKTLGRSPKVLLK